MDRIDIQTFATLDLRVGEITEVDEFPEARKPAYKLTVDLGELGVRRSSAQITDHYTPKDLTGRHVVCLVNLPPKKIAGFTSEVLVMGADDPEGKVVLLEPDASLPNGAKIS